MNRARTAAQKLLRRDWRRPAPATAEPLRDDDWRTQRRQADGQAHPRLQDSAPREGRRGVDVLPVPAHLMRSPATMTRPCAANIVTLSPLRVTWTWRGSSTGGRKSSGSSTRATPVKIGFRTDLDMRCAHLIKGNQLQVIEPFIYFYYKRFKYGFWYTHIS